jgi:hypothetical protein
LFAHLKHALHEDLTEKHPVRTFSSWTFGLTSTAVFAVIELWRRGGGPGGIVKFRKSFLPFAPPVLFEDR